MTSQPQPQPTFLTIADVCRLLQISRARCRAHIDAGDLEAYVLPSRGRFGQAVRIKRESVERFVREGMASGGCSGGGNKSREERKRRRPTKRDNELVKKWFG